MIWKAVFSLVGLISLGSILHNYGLHKLYLDLFDLGWWVVPLALSFIPVLACYTAAWHLTLPEVPLRKFPRMMRYMAASLAWNNLSPFVKVLGEPLKAVMLEELVPRKTAIRSVVLYNLVHILGTLLAFLIGASVILFHFHVAGGIRIGFIALVFASVTLFAVAYFLPRLRVGKKKKPVTKNLLWKIGFWTRWGFAKIRVFSRIHPHRFWISIFVETIARFVEGLTFYVAFLALGDPLSVLHAGLLDVGRALMDNIFFFIPYQVGSREASLMLLCKSVLRHGADSAVSVAVLYRMVEILWMAIGYLLSIRVSKPAKVST